MALSWDEFARVDMRVGVVVDAQEFPEARRPAFKLWVDFGPLGIKRSSAQITERYAPNELIGRRVVAVVNFPPKQIGPFVSEVLVLGAYDEAGPGDPAAPRLRRAARIEDRLRSARRAVERGALGRVLDFVGHGCRAVRL